MAWDGPHLWCAVKGVLHCIAQLHKAVQQLLPEGRVPHDWLTRVVGAAGDQGGHRDTATAGAAGGEGQQRGTGAGQ